MMSGFSRQPWCAGAFGFKLHLTFLVTERRTEETVAAVSFLAAAAPSGWTPAGISWGTRFYYTLNQLIHLINL